MVKSPVKTYRARADGWVAGRRVQKDDLLQLSPAQARYEPVDLHDPTEAEKPAMAKRRSEPSPS